MVIYLCCECGDDVPKMFRLTAHIQTTSDEHSETADFCSIGCLTDWAAEHGYRDDDRGLE